MLRFFSIDADSKLATYINLDKVSVITLNEITKTITFSFAQEPITITGVSGPFAEIKKILSK